MHKQPEYCIENRFVRINIAGIAPRIMSSSWGNPEYIILVADKRHEDNEVRTLGVRNTVCAFEVMLVAASIPLIKAFTRSSARTRTWDIEKEKVINYL